MELHEIKWLVVHSSKTPNDKEITAKELTRQHRLEGATDCAHHYIITRDGFEHKARNITTPGIGSETPEINKSSISICLVGTDEYTPEQLKQLRETLVSFRSLFNKAIVIGHDQIEPEHGKGCPGFDVQKWYYNKRKK